MDNRAYVVEHDTAPSHRQHAESYRIANGTQDPDDVYLHTHRVSMIPEQDEGGFTNRQNGRKGMNGVSYDVSGKLNLPTVDRKPSYETAMAKKYDDDDVDENLNTKKKTKKEKSEFKSVGTFELFRFADRLDVLFMIFGTLGAMATGCAFPINLIFYGEVANTFIEQQLFNETANKENISELYKYCATAVNASCPTPTGRTLEFEDLFVTVSGYSRAFIGIACGVLAMGYISMAFWTLAAERQTRRIRKAFFHAVLKQEIGWHDQHQSGELTARMADDINQIHEGLGEKVSTFIQWITTFVAGYVMGFIQGWRLALVILAMAPLMMIGGAIMGQVLKMQTMKELKAYAKAGAIAEEVLVAIRTVAAFGGEKKETDRYKSNLDNACHMGIKKGVITGVGLGYIWFIVYGAFAVAFYYGSVLVREQDYEPGNVLQVFFGILVGSISLGHAAPNLEAFATARGAAASVFAIIDQQPSIDSSSEDGERPSDVKGNVEFDDVYFHYPTRPDVTVLNGLSLKINVGETVALVGPSGCGKSTTVQLIQRFYDTVKGKVTIDGRDVRDLNVTWLRQNIGIVSQEPVLFAMSITENIRFGRPNATLQEIEKSAKEANAHDFIMKLPEKYDTMVGERGAQLSGGQKQRIAIARALVSNPKILLLDEATSALDTESEATVQAALDQASHGRTTIIIAHRLSTVRNADKIVGIKDGVIQEIGSHHELMETKGLYYNLVMGQLNADKSTESDFFAKFQSRARTFSDPLRRRAGSIKSPKIPHRKSHHNSESEDEDDNDSILGSFSRNHSFRESIKSLRSVTEMNIEPGFGDMYQMATEEGYDEEDGEMREKEQEIDPQIGRLMKLNGTEWPWIVLGCISAIFTGAVHPIFAVVMGEILKIFVIRDNDTQAERALFMSMMLLVIGAGACIFNFTQSLSFAVSGERLTRKLREMSFTAMMKQDIGYYDDPNNQVGACTARLASDASMVRGATGARLGNIIHALSSIATALGIAFIFGWQLTLVILAFTPIMVISSTVQAKLWSGYTKGDKRSVEHGGKLASESVDNIRTVAALTQERYFEDEYNIMFTNNYKNGRVKIHLYGLMYSFSQCIIFFAYAAAFSYGAYLVQIEAMQFYNVFRIFGAITFGGQAVGRLSSFAPDYTKAKIAAAKIFQLLDRIPPIDSSEEGGVKPDTCLGEITIRKVKFAYPTRPDVQVLQGLDVTIQQGETVALVGSSGCGKSTSVQLIERFYDPHEGSVLLDGNDVRAVNIQWLRQQIGIVSQEPILFDASIADNIAYGDNTREVRMDEIIEAARKANIHEFIEALPNGYDSTVGDKGAQLSGGQKQRIAIARALVRHPHVLLLDEATSALDTESEMIVQAALDKARAGRTCIIIAHRLSTIQNADRILVIRDGRVAEQGTHAELLATKGFYYKLNNMQVQQKRKDRVGAFS